MGKNKKLFTKIKSELERNKSEVQFSDVHSIVENAKREILDNINLLEKKKDVKQVSIGDVKALSENIVNDITSKVLEAIYDAKNDIISSISTETVGKENVDKSADEKEDDDLTNHIIDAIKYLMSSASAFLKLIEKEPNKKVELSSEILVKNHDGFKKIYDESQDLSDCRDRAILHNSSRSNYSLFETKFSQIMNKFVDETKQADPAAVVIFDLIFMRFEDLVMKMLNKSISKVGLEDYKVPNYLLSRVLYNLRAFIGDLVLFEELIEDPEAAKNYGDDTVELNGANLNFSSTAFLISVTSLVTAIGYTNIDFPEFTSEKFWIILAMMMSNVVILQFEEDSTKSLNMVHNLLRANLFVDGEAEED